MRNTVVCIITFLCFEGVLSLSTVQETTVNNQSSTGVSSHSTLFSSKSDVSSLYTVVSSYIFPSFSDSSPPVVSSTPSAPPSVSDSSSAEVSSSPSVSPSVEPSFSTIQTSLVPMPSSGSRSATPVLSSAMMTSTQVGPVNTSSPVAPVASSSPAIVTPSPTAVVVPESINITDHHNKPCLAARIEVDFVIVYNTTIVQHNKTVSKNTTIPLDGNQKINVTGACNYTAGEAFFQIKWNEHGDETGPQHTFKMDFMLDSKTKKWTVPKVMAVFQTNDTHAFKHAAEQNITTTANGTKSFGSRKNGTNFVCNGEIDVTMSNDVKAMFRDVVLQPFSHEKKLVEDGDHCSADKHDDDDDDGDDNTVPIAVGAALGGLVLIVLIAYIVGRRRSSRGYEQV